MKYKDYLGCKMFMDYELSTKRKKVIEKIKKLDNKKGLTLARIFNEGALWMEQIYKDRQKKENDKWKKLMSGCKTWTIDAQDLLGEKKILFYCGICGSQFTKELDTDYCPICKYYDIIEFQNDKPKETHTCQYCDRNTSDVDMDYMAGEDHLECKIEDELNNKVIERLKDLHFQDLLVFGKTIIDWPDFWEKMENKAKEILKDKP